MLYTKKQRAILEFVSRYQKENGYSPTLEEIAVEFGISRVTAFGHVKALERKGGVKRRPHEARSIRILDPEFSPSGFTLPLLGTIQAGMPIEAVETREVFDLTAMVPLDEEHFVLRVRGTSMIDEGIRPEDHIIVRTAKTARNGQTVVAILEDGEATLKKFFHEGDRIRLQPSNESMPPIYVDHCEIRGVAVGVFRRF